MIRFFAKLIAEGTISERKNESFSSGSLGDAAIKLYKVELRTVSYAPAHPSRS